MKKPKLVEFPKIYRWIPERVSSLKLSGEVKAVFAGFILLILFLTLLLVGLDIYKNLGEKQTIERERERLTQEIKYWQDISNKHKDYRDAYFRLAVLEYKLGDKAKASFYLQKTLELDPNFESARRLEKILSN